MVNGYSIVTYQRPLKAVDEFDQTIFVNGSQAIIWAIGPLNQRFEVSYHSYFLKKNKFIDFGRQPYWNCPIPEKDGNGKPIPPETGYYEESEEKVKFPNKAQGPTDRIDLPVQPVPTPKPSKEGGAKWDIPPIQCFEPEDGVFYAQMGPTGGKQGYPAITGHVGWGISW